MPVLIPSDAAIYNPGTGYTGFEGMEGLLGSIIALIAQFMGGGGDLAAGLKARNFFDVFVGKQRFKQYQPILREVGAADKQKLIEFMQQMVLRFGGDLNEETDRMIRDFASTVYQYLPQLQQFLPADIMGVIGGSQGLMMQAAPYIQRYAMMQAGPFGALTGDTELIGRAIARSMLEEMRMRGEFAFEGFRTKEFGQILAYGQYLGLTPGMEVEGGRITPEQMQRMRDRIAEISRVLRAARDMLSADGKEGSIVELFNLIETLGEGLLYAISPEQLELTLRRLDYTRRAAGFSVEMMKQLGEAVNKQLEQTGAPGTGVLGVIDIMAATRAGYVRTQVGQQVGAMPINQFVSQMNRVAGRVFQGDAAAGIGALLQIRELLSTDSAERKNIDRFLQKVQTGQVDINNLHLNQIRQLVPQQFQEQFSYLTGPGRQFAVEEFGERSQEYMLGLFQSFYRDMGQRAFASMGFGQERIQQIYQRIRSGQITTLDQLAEFLGTPKGVIQQRFSELGVNAEAFVTFLATLPQTQAVRLESEFAAEVASRLPSVRGKTVLESLFDALRSPDDGRSIIGKILGVPDERRLNEIYGRLQELVPVWRGRLIDLQRQYVDPNTTPERRQEILREIEIIRQQMFRAVPEMLRKVNITRQRVNEVVMSEYAKIDKGDTADIRRKHIDFWRVAEFFAQDADFRSTGIWEDYATVYSEVLRRAKEEGVTPWEILQRKEYQYLRDDLHEIQQEYMQRQAKIKGLERGGARSPLHQRARALGVDPQTLAQALRRADQSEFQRIMYGKITSQAELESVQKLIFTKIGQKPAEALPIYGDIKEEKKDDKLNQTAMKVKEIGHELLAKAADLAAKGAKAILEEIDKRIEDKVIHVIVDNWVPVEHG